MQHFTIQFNRAGIIDDTVITMKKFTTYRAQVQALYLCRTKVVVSCTNISPSLLLTKIPFCLTSNKLFHSYEFFLPHHAQIQVAAGKCSTAELNLDDIGPLRVRTLCYRFYYSCNILQFKYSRTNIIDDTAIDMKKNISRTERGLNIFTFAE